MHVAPELVEAAKRGDQRAFEQIVRETHRPIYTLVYRIVGNHDDAADVTQEVYVKVWRNLRGFRGDANLATWMYRVATNQALSHLRRRPAEVPLLERVAADEGPAAPDVAEQGLDRDVVERALAELPAGQRAVVVLKEMYGWSCAEIGKEMGLTEGAVKVRLFRARQRLARQIERAEGVVPIARKRGSK